MPSLGTGALILLAFASLVVVVLLAFAVACGGLAMWRFRWEGE